MYEKKCNFALSFGTPSGTFSFAGFKVKGNTSVRVKEYFTNVKTIQNS